MAKKKPSAETKKLNAKEQRQEKLIDKYKKQSRWITWAAIVILLLILFFVFSMGYATNWWQNPSRTSQFSPYSGETTTPAPAGTNTTVGTTGSNGQSSTSQTNSGSSNTTKETTNTTTTTNNNTTTPASSQPSNALLSLNADTGLGTNINETITRAQNLGITYNCRTELLVQVCIFSDGPYTLTTKNLLTGLGITGTSTNF